MGGTGALPLCASSGHCSWGRVAKGGIADPVCVRVCIIYPTAHQTQTVGAFGNVQALSAPATLWLLAVQGQGFKGMEGVVKQRTRGRPYLCSYKSLPMPIQHAFPLGIAPQSKAPEEFGHIHLSYPKERSVI